MVLEVLPVLPPDLRPIVQLEGGKFATTDLNDLYRRIINRNNRLKKLREMNAPEVILRNEQRMLQEAVDALIHNEKKDNPLVGRDNRPLKSISERIQGKHGRLRRNLLGRRVDYSGRAVIVVNPSLRLNQCGIPKIMALELFKPFILQKLDANVISNFDEIKNKALKGEIPEVWDILEELIKKHPVLLNRAPTLHRLGIQAFDPILVDWDAIQIHPFVCPPYNADFDGDQMAVHLPLSSEAIREARELLMSTKNILSPAHGGPLSVPAQDLIFAYYYLSIDNPQGRGVGKFFSSVREAERAWEEGIIELHSLVKIRIDGEIVDTTLGRAKLNLLFPKDLRDYNKVYDSSAIEDVIMECYHRYGIDRTVQLLDDLKELSFKWATKSGLTISITDCLISPEKERIIEESYKRVKQIQELYERGLATEEERKEATIGVWRETVEKVKEVTMENFASSPFNPIHMIVASGARGSSGQATQLSGMRGPMTDPAGNIIEMPVISNFREGLNVMEYFISTHGGRKGTADTALKTADSGYLTRRLVDACEELIIKEEDCGTIKGIEIDPLYYGKGEVMETIEERIYGRVAAEPSYFNGKLLLKQGEIIDRKRARELGRREFEVKTDDPSFEEKVIGMKSVVDIVDSEGNTIVNQDEVITHRLAGLIKKKRKGKEKDRGVKSITVRPLIVVRSPLTCETKRGVCQLCYGIDLSNHKLVELGVAVGVIAAQSIGEPGTQLTMRTFHTGGIAGEDITQGLPRAEELFEARKGIKGSQGEIANISGNVVAIESKDGKEKLRIKGEEKTIRVPAAFCRVKEGDRVVTKEIISQASPKSGEVRLVSTNGSRKLYILDREDQVYRLPKGVKPLLRSGQSVDEGTPISERFREEAAVAKRDGVVEEIIEEDGKKVIYLKDEQGVLIKHRIPYGARRQVSRGDRISKGDKLSTRSLPISIVARRPGVAVVHDGRVIIYKPKEGKTFTLTDDVTVLKEDGARVEKGEELISLNLPPGETVVIDSIKEVDDTKEITFHYESEVTLSNIPTVKVGSKVHEGDLLSKGVISPHHLLRVAGVAKTRDYLLTEIHKVYKSQGVDINDKHIELVIRQMLNNVQIKDPGDSKFFPNQLVILEEFREELERLSKENKKIVKQREEIIGSVLLEDINVDGLELEKGEELTEELLRAALDWGVCEVVVDHEGEERKVRIKEFKLPLGERVLLRISKAALETKNFLSAASFQRTTSVLAEAALRGAEDKLEGLKPSVVIGKKIPAGTGFKSPASTNTGESETTDEVID
jgi:DNA-directed RNA polymerase beta' subunit